MPHAENGSTIAPTVNGEKGSSEFLDVSERVSCGDAQQQSRYSPLECLSSRLPQIASLIPDRG